MTTGDVRRVMRKRRSATTTRAMTVAHDPPQHWSYERRRPAVVLEIIRRGPHGS